MNENTQLHDAQKTLWDMRDHLVRHDKPIAFFFCAGTSCAVQVTCPAEKDKTIPIIPAVAGLTKSCRDAATTLGEKYAQAWGLIEQRCKETETEPNEEQIDQATAIALKRKLAQEFRDQLMEIFPFSIFSIKRTPKEKLKCV